MPTYRTGVVSRFAIEHTDASAFIAVLDENENLLESGFLVQTRDGKEKAMVAIDRVKLPALFLVRHARGGLCQMDYYLRQFRWGLWMV